MLAFAVDEELRRGNWIAAEKGIREILKVQYFYPGWFTDFGFGYVVKVLFFNFSSVLAERHQVSEDSLHILLAQVLVKQGKCAEAVQVINQLRETSLSFQREEKLALEKLGSRKIRLLNCHE